MRSNLKVITGYLTIWVLATLIVGSAATPVFAAEQPSPKADGQTASAATLSNDTNLLAAAAVPAALPTTPAASPAPAPASNGYHWTGIYVGAHIGGAWGNADTNVDPLPDAATFINLQPSRLHPDPSGIIGGGQIGANWQHNIFVLGAEFDISGTGMDGRQTVSPIIQNDGTPFPGNGNHITSHQDTTWLASFRPRVGVTLGSRFLVYGTAGVAFGHVNYSADTDFRPTGSENYPAAVEDTKTGWIAGGGVEVGLHKHWSVRGEYLHYDLGDKQVTVDANPPLPPFQVHYKWQTTANIFNVGVNFRF